MTDRHEAIQKSYRQLGGAASFYDGIITRSTLSGKLLDSVVWGLDAEKAAKWVNDALAPIPENFSGKLLEVPVGTGALTIASAKRNPGAQMVGCDIWSGAYKSSFTKQRCEDNAKAEGVNNVHFEEGNAVALPFDDGGFDTVCSNYVYHNISGQDKQALLLETLRVLKPGGTFAIHDLMSKAR